MSGWQRHPRPNAPIPTTETTVNRKRGRLAIFAACMLFFGKSFAAELHVVHKSADGNLAVVGLLLQDGAENAALAPFIDNLPAEKADAKDAGVKINATDFLPAVQTTFRYSGSLTTPPCSEGVNWLVMTTPIELSSAQLGAHEALFEANNRPVQDLNDRSLVEDNTP